MKCSTTILIENQHTPQPSMESISKTQKSFIYDDKCSIPSNFRQQLQVMENSAFIWFDSVPETRENFEQFKNDSHTIMKFTNLTELLDYMRRMHDTLVSLIISIDLLENTMKHIHDFSTLDSIHVLGDDITKYRPLAQSYNKIRSLSNDFHRLLNIVHRDKRTALEREIMPTSIIPSTSDQTNNELDRSFMYSQLLTDILLGIAWTNLSKTIFVQFARDLYANNAITLGIIDEFEKHYEKQDVVWWYTRDSFVYHMLNRSLRENEFLGTYVRLMESIITC